MGRLWVLAGWHQNYFAKSWVVDDAAMVMGLQKGFGWQVVGKDIYHANETSIGGNF